MRIPDSIHALVQRVRALNFRRPGPLDMTVMGAIALALLAGFAVLAWLVSGPTVIVNNGRTNIEAARGPLSGLPCSEPSRRPIAVMLASDPEARPLSGLRSADLVIEAPVTPGGITRYMAVFQCGEPEEIGSVRSARSTFVPYVQGFDAIYAHWGGERDILDLLDEGIVDNVDALKYEGTVYTRKSSVPRPHNGFTALEALREKAEDLGYRATASIDPFLREADIRAVRNLGNFADTIVLPGPTGMEVVFKYDATSGTYGRWRGGEPELDTKDKRQVAPAVVVVLDTEVTRSYDQYIDLKVIGSGNATVYQGGRTVAARWQKSSAGATLEFTDAKGEPVPLIPGQIWIVLRATLE